MLLAPLCNRIPRILQCTRPSADSLSFVFPKVVKKLKCHSFANTFGSAFCGHSLALGQSLLCPCCWESTQGASPGWGCVCFRHNKCWGSSWMSWGDWWVRSSQQPVGRLFDRVHNAVSRIHVPFITSKNLIHCSPCLSAPQSYHSWFTSLDMVRAHEPIWKCSSQLGVPGAHSHTLSFPTGEITG